MSAAEGLMKKGKFYQAPSDASKVKQAIVATYFGAWKNVLKAWSSSPVLTYVDLYSGPGLYDDGSLSTPLLILQQAIDDVYLQQKFVAVFNDGDPMLSAALRTNIARLQGVERLCNEPRVYEYAVSDELIQLAASNPTLLFADPWGYKGLSLQLIRAFFQTPGSDCILFFNYNRINAGLSWSGFDEPLDAVFGEGRAESLRSKIAGLTPGQRERTVIDEMKEALADLGARCTLPFRFVSTSADRPSHHLLFASKHPRGCQIMKTIMREHSSGLIQGLGTFEFTGSKHTTEQLTLNGFGPLDELANELAQRFAGKTLTFNDILDQDNHPTATDRNYKDAVLQLEARQNVTVTVPGRKRRKIQGELTLPNDAVITFR
jgi:three-Cys-motif partner protein